MAKKANDAISNYSSQILGCQAYVNNNNKNRLKCDKVKKSKEGLKNKIKAKLSDKKTKRDKLAKKKAIITTILSIVIILSTVPVYGWVIMFMVNLLKGAVIINLTSIILSCLMLISVSFATLSTNSSFDKKFAKIDEEILEGEKDLSAVEAEIARIQVTIDKIDIANKITEEKITILRDAINQIEGMTTPEGAQRVVRAEPAKGIQNTNNQQLAKAM